MVTRRLRKSAVCLPLAVLFGIAAFQTCRGVAHAQNINQLRAIVGNNAPNAAQLKMLENLLKNDFFKDFKDPNNDLPGLRRDYNRIVRLHPNTPGHKRLNEVAVTELRRILRGPHHKTIKYNAMLMIADLNESDAIRNVKPLPAAYTLLMLAFNAPPSWDYLKPAVFIGLARFAENGGIPKEDTAKVTAKLLALVKDENPPPGRSASAHNFLRRGAALALAAMGSTGPGNSVVNAFAAIAADPQARPTMRCEMARFIGKLNYPPAAKVDLQRLANILGHQTVEICQQQLDRGDGKEKDGAAIRRITMYVLDSCTYGLQKLSSATEDDRDTREFIYSLKKRMDGLHRQLDGTETTNDDAVADLVQLEIGEIETMLLEKPQPEPLVASDPKEEPTGRASTN